MKQKYGIKERECYNKPKNENFCQPKCTKKEECIGNFAGNEGMAIGTIDYN